MEDTEKQQYREPIVKITCFTSADILTLSVGFYGEEHDFFPGTD